MSPTDVILSFLGVLLTIFVLSVFFGSFFTVETAQVAIVQRLGKFSRVAGPGLNWKTPLIEAVVQRMSMKVQQFDVKVETKTQDNGVRPNPRLHPIQSDTRIRGSGILQTNQ